MNKFFKILLVAAFLFAGNVFVSAQSAIDLNGIKISGVGSINFIGYHHYKTKDLDYTKDPNSDFSIIASDKNQVEFLAELSFTKAFTNGAEL